MTKASIVENKQASSPSKKDATNCESNLKNNSKKASRIGKDNSDSAQGNSSGRDE